MIIGDPEHTLYCAILSSQRLYFLLTLSVYRSRVEALPSIGPAFFAQQMVKRSNNATENGHIYARGFADDCYRLGCNL